MNCSFLWKMFIFQRLLKVHFVIFFFSKKKVQYWKRKQIFVLNQEKITFKFSKKIIISMIHRQFGTIGISTKQFIMSQIFFISSFSIWILSVCAQLFQVPIFNEQTSPSTQIYTLKCSSSRESTTDDSGYVYYYRLILDNSSKSSLVPLPSIFNVLKFCNGFINLWPF